jgi:tetratricopeptide (TPR) repeat protein
MNTATTTARRASSERRRSSMDEESNVSYSAHSRLSDEELKAVTNISTRRLLENMDEIQIEKAMEGLKDVRLRRKSSIKRMDSRRMSNNEAPEKLVEAAGHYTEEDYGEIRSSTKGAKSPNSVSSSEDDHDHDISRDAIPPPPFGKKMGGITGNNGALSEKLSKMTLNDGRRMSKSLDGYNAWDHDYSQYVSDSDNDEDDNTAPKATQDDRVYEVVSAQPRKESFKKMSRGLARLHEEEEEEDKSVTEDDGHGEEVAKKQFVGQLTPTPPRRVATGRRVALSQSVGSGTSHSMWKPLSGPSLEKKKDEEEKEEANKPAEGEAGAAGGVGGLWNKFTKSFSGDSFPSLQSAASPKSQKPKKNDGAKYFRRGKRRAERCEFLEAVALFNFALVRQREELGENHIDCGRTLNEIGLCWMMLGERYPAMTAFEEALYILQKTLGDGAEEVAEVTNNIWMVLHEQREEALMGND